MCQIFHFADLARGMTQKCIADIFPFNPASIIRDADQRNPSILNLHGNGGSFCINGIFYEFFDDRRWPLNHFTCGDLIYCNLI